MSEIVLTIRPDVQFNDCRDGTGFKLGIGNRGHAHLQIGNVSIAFDGFNLRCYNAENDECTGMVIQHGIYTDDPVRLDDNSFDGYDSAAEAMLHALAVDLGYSIEKK